MPKPNLVGKRRTSAPIDRDAAGSSKRNETVTANEIVTRTLEVARTAQPNNVRIGEDGSAQEIPGMSMLAQTMHRLSFGDLVDGIEGTDLSQFSTAAWGLSGNTVSFGDLIAANSRVMQHGTQRLDFPTPEQQALQSGEALITSPEMKFSVVEAADFQTVDLDDDAAECPVTEFPGSTAALDRDNLQHHAVRFRFSRRDQKILGDAALSAQILISLALGAGRAFDRALLQHLATSNLDTFDPKPLDKFAAKGLQFPELRGILGASSGYEGSFDRTDKGGLLVSQIPTSLSADADGFFVGDWCRAAIVCDPELTFHVIRTDVSGALEVNAWIDLAVLVPDTGSFWRKTSV